MEHFSQHKKVALVFLAPQLVVIALFFIWPSVNAIIQSFYFSDAFGLRHEFAGLQNFIDLFADPGFMKALVVTLVIGLAVTIVTLSLGLFFALLVHQRQKSQLWYKSLLLWPYAVAPAVAAILWRFLFQPHLGWISYLFAKVGIDFNYLTHVYQAFIVIILTASWQQFSYNFLFYFIALNAIPKTLLDAASLDGASVWQRFWTIIFPILSPTTFFLIVMNLLYAFFDTFGIIDVMTNGGPENATTTLIYKVYKDGFVNMDPGSSSAQSVILMIVVTLFTLVQFWYLEKRVHYQ